MPSGGYRRPENPAPVSGPGALSKRTDGGPGDPKALTGGGKYGESKALQELQSGAPMDGGQAAPSAPAPFTGMGLDAASARPGEPVTFGADAGDGAGSEVLGLASEDQGDVQAILTYLPALEAMASGPNASPSTRGMIRRIKSLI